GDGLMGKMSVVASMVLAAGLSGLLGCGAASGREDQGISELGATSTDIALTLADDGRLYLGATSDWFHLLGVAVCPESNCFDYLATTKDLLADPDNRALVGFSNDDPAPVVQTMPQALYWYGRLLRASGINAVRFIVFPVVRGGDLDWFPSSEEDARDV